MRQLIIGMITLFMLSSLMACNSYYGADPNHSKEYPREMKTNYGNGPHVGHQVKHNPNKDYLQSDEEGIAHDGTENNFFESDEDLAISQYLSKRKDVMQYYVTPFDDRVVVTVLFREDYENINERGKQIQDEIKQMAPGKQVIVYTDEYSYNQMNHIKAGKIQREAGETVEEFLERVFRVDIKD